jgi:integrase
MTNPILEKWFVQVKKLRDGLAKPDEWDRLDPKTRLDYAAKYARLAGRLPANVATCKKSYYSYRAAWRHMKSRETREALNRMDGWLREQDHDSITAADFAVQIKALGLDTLIHDWRDFTTVKYEGAAHGVAQPTHGKRKIGHLPRDWKNKLLVRVPRDSKYKLHVHVMALCGCRPSEFENTVLVQRTDEDTYTITIAGKKHGERTHRGKTFTTGQELRTLTFKRGADFDKDGYVNNELEVLDRLMVDSRGKPCSYIELKASATAIRDVVIHASERAFPKLKNRPTAYSFRHAVASELKAQNGECSEQTAAVLGHASAKTQGCYGYRQSGGRGGWTVTADASCKVRHVGAQKSYTKKIKEVKTEKVMQPTVVKSSGAAKQASRCLSAFHGGANVGNVTLAKLSVPARAVNPNLYVSKPMPSFANGMRMR